MMSMALKYSALRKPLSNLFRRAVLSLMFGPVSKLFLAVPCDCVVSGYRISTCPETTLAHKFFMFTMLSAAAGILLAGFVSL